LEGVTMAVGVPILKGFADRKARKAKNEGDRFCSFCGKAEHEVRKVIAGPSVFICDECVGLCNRILSSKAGRDTGNEWKTWMSMADSDLLVSLPEVLKRAETVREDLQSRIDELRRRDVSWSMIGDALNLSRQAAWERFS
jgi:hypothetical protein